MGKKRFVVLASEGSGFSNAMQEIVDTETGAHYLTWQSGHAGGITPAAGRRWQARYHRPGNGVR